MVNFGYFNYDSNYKEDIKLNESLNVFNYIQCTFINFGNKDFGCDPKQEQIYVHVII